METELVRQPRFTSFNLCNLPPWVIGSTEFQTNPQPIEIQGARQSDRRLFQKLDTIFTPEERSQIFHDYLSVKFRLHELKDQSETARSSLRHSYVRFLGAWGADSNGHAGAVLKAWVESRFGLRATFHQGRIPEDSEATRAYWQDRMRGASKTMGVSMQLDLVYTYCQYELTRRMPGERWLTLYRGTHDPGEYAVRGTAVQDATLVEFNNLSSFTLDPEIAWEFGSRVWEVHIPLSKIFFFSGLLPQGVLSGEAEYLVLGGAYRVKPLRY